MIRAGDKELFSITLSSDVAEWVREKGQGRNRSKFIDGALRHLMLQEQAETNKR